MPARVWQALAGLIALLLVAVVALDQWQARRGEASLFGVPWTGARPPAPPSGEPRRPPPSTTSSLDGRDGPRVAVVVDEMGGRRDVFESLRELRRPIAVAVLPGLAYAQSIARDAARSGIEVLLDQPMEPYGYPRVDPGPGSLLMSTPPGDVRRLVGAHLEALPGVVGVTNYMGSRLTEDRTRVRALLEAVRARRLFLLDAYTSNLSVAYDEARELGVAAARRQVAVDPAQGDAGQRASLARVEEWAARRGEVIVIAPGQPLTARLLREFVPRWEARGLRLVFVSELVR